MQIKNTRRGFTLIELLVVVLIIGILAAVAVPQYRISVAKSHFAILKTLVESIVKAQELYYLANGSYTAAFDELDIDMPGDELEHEYEYDQEGGLRKTIRYYNWGKCELSKVFSVCQNNLINMQYRHDFTHTTAYPGRRSCAANNTLDITAWQAKLCKAETGDSPHRSSQYNLIRYFY